MPKAKTSKRKSIKSKTAKTTAQKTAARKTKAAAAPATKTPREGKGATILELLRREGGATLTELTEATGWQKHSVRGFLAGNVKKKLGLDLKSCKREDGQRVYQVAS